MFNVSTCTLETTSNKNQYTLVDIHFIPKDIDVSFDDFAKHFLTRVQYSELKPFFESAKSWMDFFRSVPKDRQCDLFIWLPAFMDTKMKFSVNDHYWIINLGSTYTNSLRTKQYGGKSNRKTRKLRR
jgi:type III secretory pathway component EscR